MKFSISVCWFSFCLKPVSGPTGIYPFLVFVENIILPDSDIFLISPLGFGGFDILNGSRAALETNVFGNR